MLWTIIIILLVLSLLGYNVNPMWGNYPSYGIGTVLVLLIVLLLLGRI